MSSPGCNDGFKALSISKGKTGFTPHVVLIAKKIKHFFTFKKIGHMQFLPFRGHFFKQTKTGQV